MPYLAPTGVAPGGVSATVTASATIGGVEHPTDVPINGGHAPGGIIPIGGGGGLLPTGIIPIGGGGGGIVPTGIPAADSSNSLVFLPAACFQSSQSALPETFQQSTETASSFGSVLKSSTPDNRIQGFNLYVLTLLYYGAALIAELIRFIRRGRTRPGWRARVSKKFGRIFKLGSFPRKAVQIIFLLYIFFGVGLGSAVTIISGRYIFGLRAWVANSGWMESPNPENDGSSFGQLVPIFSTAIILFSFAQIFSGKFPHPLPILFPKV